MWATVLSILLILIHIILKIYKEGNFIIFIWLMV